LAAPGRLPPADPGAWLGYRQWENIVLRKNPFTNTNFVVVEAAAAASN